ncbi:helix-turn-helix transcriptional regulator [Streptomyces sp. RPT161]|uniref:helix-turn-helix transcriptional regulator n=1 Tax=Streptomyces sp. RPT161 TaxID=3015993 RepID=UPI0022B8AF1B|nr:WYL domain-containing protein [Streptomyces sp. RPT161]
MSRPTARVLALLEILQSGGVHPVADLADRLGVDARTVRRYVDHLADLDVPVESVRGRYGGYRLARGYRIPPLMLTDDEALATLLGLMTVRRAGLSTTSAAAADAATAELRRVLPQPLGRRLDALLATAQFTTPTDDAAAGPGGRVLLTLAEAAWDRHPTEIWYCARDGRRSQRVLHPYGLVAHSGRWYATGADSTSGEVRTFRVDRIEHVRTLSSSFDQPKDFDAQAHVLAGLAETPWTHDVSLRVQATRDHIRTRFPEGIAIVDEVRPTSQTRTQPEDSNEPSPGESWFRIRLRAERLEWIPPLLAALNRPFVVERPAELRGHIADLAQHLAQYASTNDESR